MKIAHPENRQIAQNWTCTNNWEKKTHKVTAAPQRAHALTRVSAPTAPSTGGAGKFTIASPSEGEASPPSD